MMVVKGTWINWSENVSYYVNTYVNTAAAFVDIKVRGGVISPAAEEFIEYVGTRICWHSYSSRNAFFGSCYYNNTGTYMDV